MRRLVVVFILTIAAALLDYGVSALSMLIPALPPARYAVWMGLLESQCANAVQLEVINAAAQWYGGPVVAAFAGFILGGIGRGAARKLSDVFLAMIIFTLINMAAGGGIDAPSLVAVFLGVFGVSGGYAFMEVAVGVFRSQRIAGGS